jgi:spermidine synthase
VTTVAAVAINVAVGMLALFVASHTTHQVVVGRDDEAEVNRAQAAWMVYLVIALSGFTALAAEVIWTRNLSLVFGATTYTFSMILAVFLVGLGIGSSAGSALARAIEQPRTALGICQLMLCACIAWTSYMVTDSLPYWPVNPSISTSPLFTMQLDLVRCFWAVLPAAIFWGASFPIALVAVAAAGQDPGRLVGSVYAANTVGAIVGALGASLVLVAWIGTQHAQQLLIVVSLFAGLLTVSWKSDGSGVATTANSARRTAAAGAALVLVTAAVMVLARSVHDVPALLIAYGRYSATRVNEGADYLYKGEGMTASVAVSRLSNGVLNYHNAGKVQASSEPQDMRLQRMLGHLTTLVPANVRSVVVIGCGAGVTAGAVSIDPNVQTETIAEIEPLVPHVVSAYFSQHNFDVVNNQKVHVQIDDGRHYILTLKGKFDALTSDPLDPWVKGAAMLYTKEFFEIVKQHLNPGGVVTLFVQLYESNTDAVKSEVATFFEAFPNGVIFGNSNEGAGYDMVLFGQVEPTTIDVSRVEDKLRRPEYARIKQSLHEIGFESAVDLFSTYAGRAVDLQPWTKTAMINRDINLRLQYLAGLSLNRYDSGPIYSEILTYRRRPEGLFIGTPETIQTIYKAIETRK